MTEFLAVTTAIVMTYAIYEVFQSVRLTHKPAVIAHPRTTTMPSPPPPPSPKVPVVHAETSSQAPAPTPSQPKPAVTITTPADRGSQVRNPASGEVTAMPTNYRFAKKWIKDALVTEGLLDKVYKPNELDDTATRKTKEALEQFRALPKYQV